MLLVSVEVEPAPGRVVMSRGGHLKRVREPVLALIGERDGDSISCNWVFTYAGLVPGPYELSDGTTVTIPQSLCGETALARRGVTLEVRDGEAAA